MRKDMAKVIVERPRIPDHKARKGRSVPDDKLPSYEGMRKPYVRHHNGKQLNENLAPLRRYLMAQVGRPWNKVYSEICSGLRINNAVQQHVRNHLSDYIAVTPRRVHWWTATARPWFQEFFVDRKTGLIRRTDELSK